MTDLKYRIARLRAQTRITNRRSGQRLLCASGGAPDDFSAPRRTPQGHGVGGCGAYIASAPADGDVSLAAKLTSAGQPLTMFHSPGASPLERVATAEALSRMSAEEIKVCSMLGVSPQAFLEQRAAEQLTKMG